MSRGGEMWVANQTLCNSANSWNKELPNTYFKKNILPTAALNKMYAWLMQRDADAITMA